MRNLLSIIWQKIRFDQKKEWDKIAYSYLRECDFVLDVGCGEGRFISQNPHKIIGADLNVKSLSKCKEHRYNVIRCTITSLPFESESIPGIHCSHVIEHFLPSDVHKILSEFDRILSSGGTLVIRSPLMWDGFYSDLTHIRPYNPEAIIHYLTPSKERTLEHISQSFKVTYLKWRYRPLQVKNRYFREAVNVFNRWGFPWFQRNGYMLIMRKRGSNESA